MLNSREMYAEFVVGKEEVDPKLMIELCHTEEAEWAVTVDALSKKFTVEALSALIKKAILEKIAKIRQYRDGIYAQNDELRAKGISFEERKRKVKLERIALCDRKESELQNHLTSFKARPLSEWLGRFDLKLAKDQGAGMGYIIGSNLGHTYVVPSKK